MPDVWLISIRGVTAGDPSFPEPSGSFHDFRIVFTSWSRPKRRSWTARRDTIAATGLLIDAAWNMVSVVTGAPVSTSATP